MMIFEAIQDDPKSELIEQCLAWIVPILDKHGVPYQVVGGLAAKFYGAKRALVDIDFYADMKSPGFPAFLADISQALVWGPEHYRDDSWDIVFLKIDYKGQRIEIGDSNDALFFDVIAGNWIKQAINYMECESFFVFGKSILVIKKQDLVAYKKRLNREVDLQDLSEIE